MRRRWWIFLIGLLAAWEFWKAQASGSGPVLGAGESTASWLQVEALKPARPGWHGWRCGGLDSGGFSMISGVR